LEVAQDILALCPEQRIVFASAYVESTLIESISVLHQMVELLQKPFSLEKLLDVVEDKRIMMN